jgi:hypothetical protein
MVDCSVQVFHYLEHILSCSASETSHVHAAIMLLSLARGTELHQCTQPSNQDRTTVSLTIESHQSSQEQPGNCEQLLFDFTAYTASL